MKKEDVINSLKSIREKYEGTEYGEAISIATECVKMIDSLCELLDSLQAESDYRNKNLDIVRGYITGFKRGVFKE